MPTDRPLGPTELVADYLPGLLGGGDRLGAWLRDLDDFLEPHVLGDVALRAVDRPGCLLATRVRQTGRATWRSARFPEAAAGAVRVLDFGPPGGPPDAVRFADGEIRVDPDRPAPGWWLFGLVAADHAPAAPDPAGLDTLAGVGEADAEVFAVCPDPDDPAAGADPSELLVRYRLAEGWWAAGAGPYNRLRQLGYAAAALAAGRALFAREVWPAAGPEPPLRADAGVACRAWLRLVADALDREVQGVLAHVIDQFRGRAP